MPAAHLKTQVLDRIVTVLESIRAGSVYFYTPYVVEKRFIHWREAKGFPTYMVHLDSGGNIDNLMDLQHDVTFYISIKGIVQSDADTPTKLMNCITDIRTAIEIDSSGGVAGSLSALCVLTAFDDEAETDNGYLSIEGFGFFDQRVIVRIIGDWGTI